MYVGAVKIWWVSWALRRFAASWGYDLAVVERERLERTAVWALVSISLFLENILPKLKFDWNFRFELRGQFD